MMEEQNVKEKNDYVSYSEYKLRSDSRAELFHPYTLFG